MLFSLFTGLQSEQKYNKIMKVFMALRINVNTELITLETFLYKLDISRILAPNGSIAIISFHSLEDKIILKHFKNWENRKLGKMVSKRPVTPSELELEQNSASKSAKLRMFIKNI